MDLLRDLLSIRFRRRDGRCGDPIRPLPIRDGKLPTEEIFLRKRPRKSTTFVLKASEGREGAMTFTPS